MKKILLLSVAILVSCLTGCMTTNLKGPTFTHAAPPSADKALVYIYRPNSTPFLLSPDVSINGQMLVELGNQGYTYTYLSPGEHNINIVWSGMAGRPDLNGKLKVEAGQTYFVRSHGHVALIGNTLSNSSYLDSIPKNQALDEIQHCIYIQPVQGN